MLKKFIIFCLFIAFLANINCTSKSKRKKEIQNDNIDNPSRITDNEGPTIILLSPKINTRGLIIVEVEKEITVSGKVTDRSGIQEIKLNNNSIDFNSKGEFSARIIFPENFQLVITATDKKSNRSERIYQLPNKNTPQPIENQEKYALVIGNADYTSAVPLNNPINDAQAIARTMENLGFIVFKYENLNQTETKRYIDNFGKQLTEHGVSLFYYAGHGLQINGINYLVPIDANPQSEQEVEYQCVEVGRVLAKMESSNTDVNILILDACRDNPFKNNWQRSTNVQGLAAMEAPVGTIIAFAADANQIALDGSNNHGLFTEELLKNIIIPNITVTDVLIKTRVAVLEKSGNKQKPADYSTLTGSFYFKIDE